jgi:hypothetical protein
MERSTSSRSQTPRGRLPTETFSTAILWTQPRQSSNPIERCLPQPHSAQHLVILPASSSRQSSRSFSHASSLALSRPLSPTFTQSTTFSSKIPPPPPPPPHPPLLATGPGSLHLQAVLLTQRREEVLWPRRLLCNRCHARRHQPRARQEAQKVRISTRHREKNGRSRSRFSRANCKANRDHRE